MTIKEIANLAGVSISTVSKIVNQKDQNINPKTRERVLQIVKEYNYTPYGTVKNISTAKTFLLGVLLCNAAQTNLMVTGILHTAQKYGYSILLLDSHNDMDTELKHITVLCKNNVDGVIWEPVCAGSLQNEHHFEEQDISVCHIKDSGIASAFRIDFKKMGYILTQKLIDYKHTKIACLLKQDSLRSQMVFEGFRKCLFDHQIPYDRKMELYIQDTTCFSRLLSAGFSGIVSSHFASSLTLYEQMAKLHYYIPSDLSLVSLKDDVREAISFPHISSIKIPYREFGSYVCSQLIAKCEKKETSSDSFLFTTDSVFDTESSLEIPSFFRAKKIVVVGSINTDFTFNVERIPQIGKTTSILNSTTSLGGKGANQSIGAAKLGREVALIGEIGNDTDSSFIIDILEQEHVITHGIHRDAESPTGKAYIYIEKNGEGTITVLAGANNKLSPASIQRRQHIFEKSGYCLISTELPIATVLEAAETARKYGAKTILKPATLKEIPDELYQNIDILVPNRKEAAALCPECLMIEDQADFLFRKGVPVIIITLGHEGCYLKTADTEKFFPASDFISIDTTGGADAFISALASYLIEGYSIEKSIRIATYAAGFCISRQGVVPALVDRSTLHAHIKRAEPDLLDFKEQ